MRIDQNLILFNIWDQCIIQQEDRNQKELKWRILKSLKKFIKLNLISKHNFLMNFIKIIIIFLNIHKSLKRKIFQFLKENSDHYNLYL
jgi:hypothetical protein